jgi:hypothetical protein
MAGQTEFQLKELWRVGLPLEQAWLTYAHPDVKARWSDLAQKSALDGTKEALEEFGPLDMPAHEKFQRIFAPATAILTARTSLKDEMKAAILRYIEAGNLFAYGFEPPRRLASAPVALPKTVMLGEIDWEKNTVRHAGLSFEEVKLTTRRYWNEVCCTVDPVPPSTVRAKGRPSVGPHIVNAARALLSEGKINPEHSAKSHFPEIRTWLAQHSQDMPVPPLSLNDETIRRHFTQFFKELKNTNKQ